jgi:AraC-like DNA-binding protein
MRTDLLISGSWTQMVLRSFEAVGLDPRKLCATAGLSYAELSDADARLPRDLSGRLWREAARVSGDRQIGLRAGERVPPSANNILSHMLISSPTLLAGLERTLSYQRVLAHGRVGTLEKRRDAYALCFQRVDGDLPILREEIEFMTTALMRLLRFAVPRRWRLAGVRYEFPVPASTSEYERIFRCPVEFAQRENSLLIPEAVMTARLEHHCPAAFDALQAAADAALERVQHPSLVAEVRAKILARLRSRRGDCSVESIATTMHVSPRTLQRRLEADGSSFSAVLEQAQRDRCMELLESTASLEEIGAAIGLSGSRALARAFKLWTGRTPSEHRRLAREAAGMTLQ